MDFCLLGGDGVGVSSRVGDGRLESGLEEPDEKLAILMMKFELMCMRRGDRRNRDQEVGIVFHAQRVRCYGGVRLPPNSFL